MKTSIQVLHLEDDNQDAELVQALLEAADLACQITRVQSGAEFSAALIKEKFDIILADYHLPGYNGISALRLAQEFCSDVPFIFVSGMMGEDAAIEGLTQGATDYVLKNRLARLAPAIKRALEDAENKRERKQMAEALAAREREFRTLAENSPDNIARYDVNCRTIYVNPTLEKTLGCPPSELLGATPVEAGLIAESRMYQDKIAEVLATGKEAEMDLVMPDRGEGVSYHNIRFVAERRADGAITGVQAIGRDITERKQAEQEHLAHLRFLESMDQISRAVQGTNDLEQMMSDVLDVVLSVLECDRAFLMYPCDPDAPTWRVPMERTRPEYPAILAQGLEMPMEAELAEMLRLLLKTNGPVILGSGTENTLSTDASERFGFKTFMSMALFPKIDAPWQFGIHQCSYARIWTSDEERLFQEIGRRLSDALTSLLVYRNLQESEERYRRLVELSPDAIGIYTQDKIVFVNSALAHMTGVKEPEEMIGKSVLELIHPDDREFFQSWVEETVTNGVSSSFVEGNILRLDGSTVDVEVAAIPFQQEGQLQVQIVARDITERKHHELEREAIITVSNALRRATTRTEILTVILDQLVDLFAADGAMAAFPNPSTEEIIIEMGRGKVGNRFTGLHISPGQGISGWVIANQQPYLNNRAAADARFYRPDLLADAHCVAAVPLIAKEQAFGVLWVARQIELFEQDLRLFNAIGDIAASALHRVTLHEQTKTQLHHLMALHQIDLAITTNLDLSITLSVILNSVKNELDVGAASILLLTPFTQTLEYAAGVGFRTRAVEQARVKLGTGNAGRAALSYQIVSCPDLSQSSATIGFSTFTAVEGFLSHFVAPLIVKGQVKGILEVFQRRLFEPDQDWLTYFETLATQTAIAIENASLFENLQRSNTELKLAYDDTIEGWSRALDLRDKETEGHTLRVTEMTLRLADKLGMSDIDKLNLRRGALLHDIGKMGVPDTILLKPGPLTDDEWKIMRQHPIYAHEMLKPIEYLRPAVDIPYCHHEKWDGSGYPRGLQGEAIPLAARVFAVIDVFDALIVDRPYRLAWPRAKVQAHIQEQSGKHFDPAIVAAFLQIEI